MRIRAVVAAAGLGGVCVAMSTAAFAGSSAGRQGCEHLPRPRLYAAMMQVNRISERQAPWLVSVGHSRCGLLVGYHPEPGLSVWEVLDTLRTDVRNGVPVVQLEKEPIFHAF